MSGFVGTFRDYGAEGADGAGRRVGRGGGWWGPPVWFGFGEAEDVVDEICYFHYEETDGVAHGDVKRVISWSILSPKIVCR